MGRGRLLLVLVGVGFFVLFVSSRRGWIARHSLELWLDFWSCCSVLRIGVSMELYSFPPLHEQDAFRYKQ